MSKERELLKKALHVLTSSKVWGGKEYTYLPIHPCQYKGISAEIKELLAQPEQEPVAWRYKTHNRYTYTEENYHELEGEGEPLYASPQKREPLSDAEINDLDNEVFGYISKDMFRAVVRLIRKVEKAHGIEE